ncbi:MAG: hypothetical protein ACXWV9_02765 [Flavisolibacter sp.]
MTDGNSIKYLEQHEIDKSAWDNCIDQAPNGLIYGYSFYLDHMADHWDGLVLNDYEAVFPLPWRKKYGIHYLYQPFLTAQLGLFGKDLHASLLQEFLIAIPKKFKLWEFPLNYANIFPLNEFHLYQRTNYILDLNRPYKELYNQYRENSKRNNKKAVQSGCHQVNNFHLDHILKLIKNQPSPASDADLARFTNLYYQLKNDGKAKIYGIQSKQGELIASAVFIFSHNRAYYILVGNHPNGKTLGASHALIDSFIRDHAGQDLILDFEGSDMRSLAFFYSSFGAHEEKYAAIKRNLLPWYVRLFKK